MAKVLTSTDGLKHLQGKGEGTLCGAEVKSLGLSDDTLTCPTCAKIALKAMELVTKAEKRSWRLL